MSSTSGKRSRSQSSPRGKRSVQNAVRQSESLAILDSLNLPVSVITHQYRYRWVNTCYAACQGKKREHVIGKRVSQLWGSRTFNRVIKPYLERCFEGDEIRSESWISLPALGLRYCEVVYSPYRPDGQSVLSAIVITYDITERKEIEERLRQSEERFRELSEASLEAMVIIEDGVIVDGNKALNRLFGYEEDESARGRRAADFIAAERRAFTEEMIRTRTEGFYETLGLRKDGSIFPIEVNSKQLQAEGRNLRAVAVRDLTERKRIDAQLTTYREQLEKLVEERTKQLEAEHLNLQEANTALKVLLKQREDDRKELEERLIANVRQLVFPHVEKLKTGKIEPEYLATVHAIEANIKEILSPFLNNVRVFNFTPRQLEIIGLIKAGSTTKDIAAFLHLSKEAIDTQRFLIRKKLGLNKEKTNLRSYLLSLA